MPIRCPRCSTPPPFDPFLCTACGEHLLTYLDEPLGPGSGVGVRPMGTMTVPRADGPTEVGLVGHQQPPPPVPPSDNTGPFILKGLFGLFVAMILFSIETMSGLLYLPILALMLWRWPRARLIPSFLALAGLAAGVLLVVAFIDEIDLTGRIDPTPEPDYAATSTALVIEGTPTLSPAALTATATVVAGQNQVKISRARARWLRGDNATAQAELNDVLTLIPGLPEALNLRAMVRIAAGDHEGAAADAERAVDAQPSNRAYVDTRGYALLKLGRYEAAASDYDRVLSSPRPERYVGAYLGRGVARTALGRLVEARADLEMGLRLLPDADPDPQLADLEILARRALDPLAPRPGAGSPSPAASPGVEVTPGPMASPSASPAALRPERPGSAAIPSLRSGQALAAPVRSGQDGRAPRGTCAEACAERELLP